MNQAFIVQDIVFGDCSKGATVDYLAHRLNSKLVIRHSGGPQCAHNVVVGKNHHCFQSIGSGTFAGADTLILDGVVINPFSIRSERLELMKKGFDPKVYIHENCQIITPFHIALNRLREAKLRHGSCGQGVWATVEYGMNYRALRVKDVLNTDDFDLKYLLREIQLKIQELSADLPRIECDYVQFLDDLWGDKHNLYVRKLQDILYHSGVVSNSDAGTMVLSQKTPVIFEGNQGTLLDEHLGEMPHVSGDCTYNKALSFLDEIGYDSQIQKLGVMRGTYMTRHGNGPLNREFDAPAKGDHNQQNEWQGKFRVGFLDIPLLIKSLEKLPVDSLVLSHMDNNVGFGHYFNGRNYTKLEFDLYNAIAQLSDLLDTPVSGFSVGPDRMNRFINPI